MTYILFDNGYHPCTDGYNIPRNNIIDLAQHPEGTVELSTKFAAPTPKPRLAKAFQITHLFAPAYRLTSA